MLFTKNETFAPKTRQTCLIESRLPFRFAVQLIAMLRKKYTVNFLRRILVLVVLAAEFDFDSRAQDRSDAKSEFISDVDVATSKPIDEISKVLMANYNAMEEKKSKIIQSFYHPKTNLITSKEQLDQFFSQTDVSYSISNIRYIGNDGENYVIVYREVTEFRRRGSTELADKVDTDVLMVFRKHDEKFKIFTSKSLKPGP